MKKATIIAVVVVVVVVVAICLRQTLLVGMRYAAPLRSTSS